MMIQKTEKRNKGKKRRERGIMIQDRYWREKERENTEERKKEKKKKEGK